MEIKIGNKKYVIHHFDAYDKIINYIYDYLQQFETKTLDDANSIFSELSKNASISIYKPRSIFDLGLINRQSQYSSDYYSLKTANIKLNMKKVIKSVPAIIVGGTTLNNDSPIVKVCVAIYLWQILVDAIKITVTKEQAFLMIALWKNCYRKRISVERGLECVNALLKEQNEEVLTKEKYWKLLCALEDIKCIEINEGEIKLQESIEARVKLD